jgi:hypothetical protein
MYSVVKKGECFELVCDGVCVKGDIENCYLANKWKARYENRDKIQARKDELHETITKWKLARKSRIASLSTSRRTNKK